MVHSLVVEDHVKERVVQCVEKIVLYNWKSTSWMRLKERKQKLRSIMMNNVHIVMELVQKHLMIIRHVHVVEEQVQFVHSNVLHLEHLLIKQHVQTVMEQEKLLKKNVHIVMGMDMSIKI